MLNDNIELLDRQNHFVSRQQEPIRFLLCLCSFIEAISRDPRTYSIIKELEVETIERLDQYKRHDNDCKKKLKGYRAKLHELFPSQVPSPSRISNEAGVLYPDGILAFDLALQKATPVTFPRWLGDREDSAISKRLIRNLLLGMSTYSVLTSRRLSFTGRFTFLPEKLRCFLNL